jgi:hypothetical protein
MVGKTFCHRFICPAEERKVPDQRLKMTERPSERVLLDRNGRRFRCWKTVEAATIDGGMFSSRT